MDRIKDRTVTVVEAVPKADRGPEPLCLSGKAWIDPDTADILKIKWTQQPAERAEVFTRREQLLNGDLRLTARAEFKTEKNGFRFPSMLTIEEAYLNKRGRAFIRSVAEEQFVLE